MSAGIQPAIVGRKGKEDGGNHKVLENEDAWGEGHSTITFFFENDGE